MSSKSGVNCCLAVHAGSQSGVLGQCLFQMESVATSGGLESTGDQSALPSAAVVNKLLEARVARRFTETELFYRKNG